MIRHTRLATPEEIEAIKDKADLDFAQIVLALDDSKGGTSFGVIRLAPELDPVIFSDTITDVEKARFIYALEERLAGMGLKAYYFNVDADEEDSAKEAWHKNIQHWGAERQSPTKEFRFKKIL